MSVLVVTSDNLKAVARPLVVDAAESLESAQGIAVERVMAWYDATDVEDLQYYVQGFIQDGILAGLGLDRDYQDPSS